MTYITLCYSYSGLNPEIIDRMPNDLVEAFLVAIGEINKEKSVSPSQMRKW